MSPCSEDSFFIRIFFIIDQKAEWGLAEEIFTVKIYFFALTPVLMWNFLQYSLIMTLKYGILSQSTAVFPQSVENVVNTRSSMGKKKIPSYTVKPV